MTSYCICLCRHSPIHPALSTSFWNGLSFFFISSNFYQAITMSRYYVNTCYELSHVNFKKKKKNPVACINSETLSKLCKFIQLESDRAHMLTQILFNLKLIYLIITRYCIFSLPKSILRQLYILNMYRCLYKPLLLHRLPSIMIIYMYYFLLYFEQSKYHLQRIKCAQ